MNSNQPIKEGRPGWYYPIGVVVLWEEDKINAQEFILLGTIQMLEGSGKKGCWASNKYLAERMKMTVNWISQMLANLEAVGAIRLEYPTSNSRLIFCSIQELYHPGDERVAYAKIKGSHMQKSKGGVINIKARTPDSTSQNPPLSSKYSNKYSTVESAPDVADSVSDGFGVTPKQSFEQVAASKLETALRERRKLMSGTPNRKAWAATFSKLLQGGEVDKARFKATLTWYLANIGKEYVPQAYSAEAFCKKFIQIEDAMNSKSKKSTTSFQPTESDQELFQRFSPGLYTDAVNKHLMEAIHFTALNYRAFLDSFIALYDTIQMPKPGEWEDREGDNMLIPYVKRKAAVLWRGHVYFTHAWIEGVIDRRKDWAQWDGDLRRDIFTPTHKDFVKWGSAAFGIPEELLTHLVNRLTISHED